MRADLLKRLQPFVRAVEQWRRALHAEFPRCRCQPDEDGRYQTAGRVDPKDACRTTTYIAVRVHLAQLRMPVEHLTDPELFEAVDLLHETCLQLPRLSDEEAVRRINAALRSERVPQAGDRRP